jgi:hypothetical protein
VDAADRSFEDEGGAVVGVLLREWSRVHGVGFEVDRALIDPFRTDGVSWSTVEASR